MDHDQGKAIWYILGAGALGSLWAGYWRLAGFQVVLITRTERQNHFIHLHRQQKYFSIDCDQLTVDQLLASDCRIKHLLVSTKAQDTIAAVTAIKPAIDRRASVLLLQNGMTNKPLSDVLRTQKIISGISSDGAYRTDPQTVVHAGFGVTYMDTNKALLKQLPTAFLTLKTCTDLNVRQWRKLAVNCAINGLTAIHHCKNGELLNIPAALKRIENVCVEVDAVAKATGVDADLTGIESEVKQILADTAENFSSMYQDIHHGRHTEIDYLNGYICELAERSAIPCDENKRIVEQIKQLQRR